MIKKQYNFFLIKALKIITSDFKSQIRNFLLASSNSLNLYRVL